MRRLANIIGLPKTLLFLQKRGGTVFRFPLLARDSLLAELIGYEYAALLVDSLGGEVWELPKADKILIKIRNQVILEARENHSNAELALMFDLTRRQIINIANEGADDTNQDLFS